MCFLGAESSSTEKGKVQVNNMGKASYKIILTSNIEKRRRILLANRAYFSVLHLIKSRTIHQKNKIRIYKTIIRPIPCYGCEAWMMTSNFKEMLDAFERKILR
jgi:hypothetical protein